MTLSKLSWRQMRLRPLRAFLTLTGVAIGVATVLSIGLAMDGAKRAYSDLFRRVAGDSTFEILATGGGAFDVRDVEPTWQGDPDIRAAMLTVQSPAAIIANERRELILTIGGDTDDLTHRGVEIQEGRLFTSGAELLLPSPLASALAVGIGDRVSLHTVTGLQKATVVGLTELSGAATFNGGNIAFLPRSTSSQWFLQPGRINGVQLVLADGADAKLVGERLRAKLPARFQLRTPDQRGGLGRDVLAATDQGLAVLSLVSLIAGGFVILNTFLMSVSERRKHLALLRELGLKRREMQHWLLKEGLVYGCIGTVLGLGLGVLLALVMNAGVETALGVELPEAKWRLGPFLWAALLGPVVSLVATYFPARAASQSPLLSQIDGAPEDPRAKKSTARNAWIGLKLLAVCVTAELSFVYEWFPQHVRDAMLAPTMALFIVASILVLPALFRTLLRISRLVLGGLLGAEGELATRGLRSTPTRTILTVGVLYVAVVVAIGQGNALKNSVDEVQVWFDRTLTADYFVRADMVDRGLALPPPIPSDTHQNVAKLPGVRYVERISFFPAQTKEGVPFLVLAREAHPQHSVPIELVDTTVEEASKGLRQGHVVIGTVLAKHLELSIGDAFEIMTPNGAASLEVAGTATMYTTGGMSVILDWNRARDLLARDELHVVGVYAQPEQTEALADAMQSFCDENDFMLQPLSAFRQLVVSLTDKVVVTLWGLIVLVFVVASLGVVNTLTMNVLDQTREIGILRAVALTRRQIARVIVSQSVHMAFMSLIPGVPIGILLSYFMSLATYSVSGYYVEYQLEWWLVLACSSCGIGIALLAALVPSRNAANLDVLAALRYE